MGAFDGALGVEEATNGRVSSLNLAKPQTLWRTFDWVMCLEVAEHVPFEFEEILLDNIGRHLRTGLVMSWSNDASGIGHVNCRPEEEWRERVATKLGLVFDRWTTEAVK